MTSVVTMERNIKNLVLANESISWTPDLMGSLKRDPYVIERLMSGNIESIRSFFTGHKIKMENFHAYMSSNLGDLDNEIREMSEGGISIISLFDEDYPVSLRNIPDPPLVIYHVGTLFDMSSCVAVSGTRHPSESVKKMTFDLARFLAERRYTVTSGLALGVDTCAHEGALSVDEATSVAVMASGLDRVVPKCNIDLAKRIASRGAVLSEKCIRPEPSRHDFIRRNRIISGVSRIQIIMQSYGRGGTEQQFKIALGQGKVVLVYEGRELPEISKKAAQDMVKKGAVGFETSDEVLDTVKSCFNEVIPSAEGKDLPDERWF